MDTQKTGALIAKRRKEKNMTQKELAEQLNVTDKAVSRWETGTGFPDKSLLQPLAKALDISVAELMGEEVVRHNEPEPSVLAEVKHRIQKNRTEIGAVLIALGAYVILSTTYTVGMDLSVLLVGGIGLIGAGLALIVRRRPSAKARRLLSVLGITGALVLEILPGGAILIFAGPTYYNRNVYSCFDLMLVGYGSFSPFLAGLLTIAASVMVVVNGIRKHDRLIKPIRVTAIVAAILILLPGLINYACVSGISIAISLLLIAAARLYRAFQQ